MYLRSKIYLEKTVNEQFKHGSILGCQVTYLMLDPILFQKSIKAETICIYLTSTPFALLV